MKDRLTLQDRMFAASFSYVSRNLKRYQRLDAFVVGKNTIPDGWQFISQRAASIDDWITFAGDPACSKMALPNRYRYAGIIAMEADALVEAWGTNAGARHAIAIRFGQAMVVGALDENVMFTPNPADRSQMLSAARIGHSDVTITGGVLTQDNEFIGVPSSEHARRTAIDVPSRVPIA